MSTQKNEHNPDWTPNQYGAPDWRLLSRDEDTQQDGDEWWDWEDGRWMLVEPHMFGKRPLVGLTYRRRITPPTDDLLSLLQQIETHCPCGARPESLDTHPHASGCPVEQALVIVRSGPPEGWQKYAENLAFKLGQSHRTTGSWREGETAGKAILLPFLVTVLSERHHTGSVTTGAQALIIHASDANSALGIGVKRYKDENPEAAISNTDVVPINMEAMPLVIELRAQVEALRRDGEELGRKLEPIYHQLCVLPPHIGSKRNGSIHSAPPLIPPSDRRGSKKNMNCNHPSQTPETDAFYKGEPESDDQQFAAKLERRLIAALAHCATLQEALEQVRSGLCYPDEYFKVAHEALRAVKEGR